jgi:hypothetical protein
MKLWQTETSRQALYAKAALAKYLDSLFVENW